MQPAQQWLLLQLSDAAFPTGGFVHSGGLEAACQLGLVSRLGLAQVLSDLLEQWAATQLPFAAATVDAPDTVGARDRDLDLRLLVPAANRASRAQGAALLATCAKTFRHPELIALRARARAEQAPCHWAPCVGAVAGCLGLPRMESLRSLLYQQLRALVSSAVRLGACGPLEGQFLQQGMSAGAEALLQEHADRPWWQAAQTQPLCELVQGCHDRLYSRLFAS